MEIASGTSGSPGPPLESTAAVEHAATSPGPATAAHSADSRPPRYALRHVFQIAPKPELGSLVRMAFDDEADGASVFLKRVLSRTPLHYHKQITEVYYVLEGQGTLELDGRVHPVGPGSTAIIRPGCWHRANGHLRLLIVAVPGYDPDDEFTAG